ncbi:transglutaminase-like putative cysteine protease [Microbacterium sp. SORGH_AS 1204]|uniref:transglutaminase-like domain-containing protein n=1 Tax=Microbacterium sp. SORGH_AS_1204 TaxID=3041785 RepID=UPI00278FC941|nr:transglutaminase family protein [Microbacterium sp. SORGH_AS_1204]MDQ1137911.1 transglutaminase-like putative cysteine protease [Microbacterium sp. SORGH_AS_1204]
MTSSVDVVVALQVDGEAEVVLSVVPAAGWVVDEALDITVDGVEVHPVEHIDAHGTRLHRATLPVGTADIHYRGVVAPPAAPAPSDDVDPVRYLRPSRYAPSDAIGAAAEPFAGLPAREAVARIPAWVWEHLSYVPGSSGPTDTALDTLREREGVCRDYAHLTIALLRASGVPARLVSAFAPGLDPMDFHAVVEAFVDGRWEVVDATRLAPRDHLVRIATGRDAADTAFLTTLSGSLTLTSVTVTAVVDGDVIADDHARAVLLR